MRIIAGKNRGTKLETLEGLITRPTLDATKGAIFSSMGEFFPGYEVLDVFGGSGALSLESLSRGANHAIIIDKNIEAINIIKKNVSKLHYENNTTILHADYVSVLPKLVNKKFDIIFLDPPFKLKVIDELISFIHKNNMLNIGGYIMAEYPKEDIINKEYIGYKIKLCKIYSSSEILILERE